MGDKKLYQEACDKLDFQLKNKRNTLNLIHDQWYQANEKRREIHKLASEIEDAVSEGTLTYGEAATRMDATRLVLKTVGHNVYVNGLYFFDKYKDRKFRNIEHFMSSSQYRTEWRNETEAIIKESFSHMIGNKTALLNECPNKPCRYFNNGKCKNLECQHKHVCSECYHILKKVEGHVFSPDCPLYLIRKSEFQETDEVRTKRTRRSMTPDRTKRPRLEPPSSSSSSSESDAEPRTERKSFKKTTNKKLIKKSK